MIYLFDNNKPISYDVFIKIMRFQFILFYFRHFKRLIVQTQIQSILIWWFFWGFGGGGGGGGGGGMQLYRITQWRFNFLIKKQLSLSFLNS